MYFKLLVMCIIIKPVKSRINLDLKMEDDGNVTIDYTGIEVHLITDDDIKSFGIDDNNLQNALKAHYGRCPNHFYLKSPTPWGDLYDIYKWEQVSRILSIKSARLKGISKRPIVMMTQDFENVSNKPIKVNTGISHSIENTLTTSWSQEKEITVSQEIEYDVNVIFAKISGTTGFSYTSNWGVSEEKSRTETIGSSSGVETELEPGQAVTAVLSANAGYLEIEVVHKAILRGNLAVNFRKSYNGHHFWGPPIQNVIKSGGLTNEMTTLETIKFGFHVDASLKVYDKKTGLPL